MSRSHPPGEVHRAQVHRDTPPCRLDHPGTRDEESPVQLGKLLDGPLDAGIGYLPASLATAPGVAFVSDPPIAVSPVAYNRPENTSDIRVAYGKGMSEWCKNCHGSFQHIGYPNPTMAGHPAGNDSKLLDIANEYNAYLKSYIYTGTFATAYTSMVPFEEGVADLSILAAETGSTAGASSTDNVMCLTCHRAHASAWDNITRWNAAPGALLTVNGAWPGINAPTVDGQKGEYATGKTQAEYQQAMCGRDATQYATTANQGSLCNKCHWNDSYKVLPE